MLCPLMCAAQSEWEAPTNHNNANEAKTEKKGVKKEAKNSNTAIDHKDIKDWEYIKLGVVPEVNGKVEFGYELDLPGLTAQQVYDKAYVALDSLAHTDNQINSCVALVNRKEHIIAARVARVFEKLYLARPHQVQLHHHSHLQRQPPLPQAAAHILQLRGRAPERLQDNS